MPAKNTLTPKKKAPAKKKPVKKAKAKPKKKIIPYDSEDSLNLTEYQKSLFDQCTDLEKSVIGAMIGGVKPGRAYFESTLTKVKDLETASACVHKMLKKTHLLALHQTFRNATLTEGREKRARYIQELEDIAFTKHHDIPKLDSDGNPAEGEKVAIEIKTSDKNAALKELVAMQGLNSSAFIGEDLNLEGLAPLQMINLAVTMYSIGRIPLEKLTAVKVTAMAMIDAKDKTEIHEKVEAIETMLLEARNEKRNG